MRNVFVTILTLFIGISSFAQSNISAMEYFIDTDFGVGSSLQLPVTNAANIDEVSSIPSSSMTQGFHTIGFRVQDATGTWSMTSYRPVYVSNQRVTAIENLADIEYFIDNDPGFGNGTPVTFSPGTDIDVVESIPTSALSEGFHNLSLRSRDALGNWGIINTIPFYMSSNSLTAISDINNVEYFIDNDPGFGNGTPVLSTFGPSIDLIESIPTTTLNEGIHLVTFRVQDVNGDWSVLDSKPFYVTAADINVPASIARLEYYIDADPGVGNATSLDVTDAVSVDFSNSIDPSGISKGFHQIGYRALSTDSVWSMQSVRNFYYDGGNMNTDLAALEYFFDTDPGFGNATEIILTPEQSIDSVITFITSTLDTGDYSIGIRTRTADTTWGLTEYHYFRVNNFSDPCETDSLALVAMYDSLEGANWVKASSWLQDPIAMWEGVTLTGCRVTELNLNGEGLTGLLPDEIGDLTALTSLDLSNNQLGSIPDAILQDTSLQTLLLTNTGLSHLPNLDTLPILSTVHVDQNQLDFEDLEYAYGGYSLVAEPQAHLSNDTTIYVTDGDDLSIGMVLGGSFNLVQWYKDGVLTLNTNDSIDFIPISKSDTGTYQLEIQNSLISGVTLYSGNITIIVNDSATVITDTGSTTTDPIAFFAYEDLLTINPTCQIKDLDTSSLNTNLGSLSISNDSIIFQPSGIIGTDTIAFIAENFCGDFVQDEIVVTVLNSPPHFTDDNIPFQVNENDYIELSYSDFVRDVNFNFFDTVTIIEGPHGNPSVSLDAGYITLNYGATDFEGIDSIKIQACDTLGACSVGTIYIDILFAIDVRNLVTPNADDKNDYLHIENITRYPGNTVRLFSKWGDLVYTSKGYDNLENRFDGWRRTSLNDSEGAKLPGGTYYYIIELKKDDKDADHCLDKRNEDFKCEGFLILITD